MSGFIIALVVIVGGFLVGRFVAVPQLSQRPDNLGVSDDGLLQDCPRSPNCVNSQTGTGYAEIEPIHYTGDADDALNRLVGVINGMDRSEIVTQRSNYIHAEFKSALWGFIDDVEFYIDDDEKVIHFRSAARLGQSDINANRRRMIEVRRRFDASAA